MKRWKIRKHLFSSKNNTPDKKITQEVISDVYTDIKPSLDSLKAYDKGEKEIHAPDLRTTLSHIQRTS